MKKTQIFDTGYAKAKVAEHEFLYRSFVKKYEEEDDPDEKQWLLGMAEVEASFVSFYEQYI